MSICTVAEVLATHSTYLLSLNLGKEPIPYTNDQGATAAVHPFQLHGMPLFASAQICTIDINYGPSHTLRITENLMMWIFQSRLKES